MKAWDAEHTDNRITDNISCLWLSDQNHSIDWEEVRGHGPVDSYRKQVSGPWVEIILSDYYSQSHEWTRSILVWFISCRHILHTAGVWLRKRTNGSKWKWGRGDINLFTLTKVSAKIRPHKRSLLLNEISLVNYVLPKWMQVWELSPASF